MEQRCLCNLLELFEENLIDGLIWALCISTNPIKTLHHIEDKRINKYIC